jgi:hypothetical protein
MGSRDRTYVLDLTLCFPAAPVSAPCWFFLDFFIVFETFGGVKSGKK